MPPFPVSIQDTNYNVKLGLMCFRTRQIPQQDPWLYLFSHFFSKSVADFCTSTSATFSSVRNTHSM